MMHEQAVMQSQSQSQQPTLVSTSTPKLTKLSNVAGGIVNTNVLHLAGIIALAVLLGLRVGPETAELTSLAGLIGLGINTTTAQG